jgi:hypothetical protein
MDDDVNRVLFPLRSNVGWFQSSELQKEIAKNIKQSILLYDEIYIEDGTLLAEVKQNGSSVWYAPPGRLSNDQRSIESLDLEPSDIPTTIDSVPLLTGKSIARFKIDYYKIFEDVNLSDFDFVKFVSFGKFSEEFDKIIRKQTREDERGLGDFGLPRSLRDLIISNLNHDIMRSLSLESALVLDSAHYKLIEKKCALSPSLKRNGLPIPSALRELMKFPAPDFSKMTMDQALELREEAGWQELRNAVTSIVFTVQDNPEIFSDPMRLEETIQRECTTAIFKELERLHPSGRDTAIDLALSGASFLPVIGPIPGAISAGKTLYKYLDQRDNWTAFLMKLAKYK